MAGSVGKLMPQTCTNCTRHMCCARGSARPGCRHRRREREQELHHCSLHLLPLYCLPPRLLYHPHPTISPSFPPSSEGSDGERLWEDLLLIAETHGQMPKHKRGQSVYVTPPPRITPSRLTEELPKYLEKIRACQGKECSISPASPHIRTNRAPPP